MHNYMHKLELCDISRRRKCGYDTETSFHILGQCPVYVGLRRQLLGSELLEPDQIRQLPVKDLLYFWKRTGLE